MDFSDFVLAQNWSVPGPRDWEILEELRPVRLGLEVSSPEAGRPQFLCPAKNSCGPCAPGTILETHTFSGLTFPGAHARIFSQPGTRRTPPAVLGRAPETEVSARSGITCAKPFPATGTWKDQDATR